MSSITLNANDAVLATGNQLAQDSQRSVLFRCAELRKTAVAIYSAPVMKLFAFLTLSLLTCLPAIQAINAGWNLAGFGLLGVVMLLFVAGFEVAAAASGVEESF